MIKSWKEMPIGVLQEMDCIGNLHISDEEKTFRAAALLAEMEYEDFLNLSLDEAREIVAQTDWVKTEPKRVKVQKEYQINGHTYYLHKNIMGISTAAYIDFQAICQNRIEDYLPELMAIVLIPIGHKYADGYDQQEVIEEIRDYFNVEDALSVADFFITKSNKSIRQTQAKLDAMLALQTMMAKKEEKPLLRELRKEAKKAMDALRSAYGCNWQRQWPK